VLVARTEAVKKRVKQLQGTHQLESLDKSVHEELRKIVKEAWERKRRRK